MPWSSVLLIPLLAAPVVAVVPQDEPREPGDFLLELALQQGWAVTDGPGQRWRLVQAGCDPALAAAGAALLERGLARLDDVLGEQEPRTLEPATLFLAGDQEAVDLVSAALAAARPHLAEWAEAIRTFPRFQHWAPLVALVRAGSGGVPFPEAELLQVGVQLDLCRRYGRLPFWVGEALGYALQDELLGEVQAISFHPGGAVPEEWGVGWGHRAAELLLAPGFQPASLARGSGQSFLDDVARARLGTARWWLARAGEDLARFLERLARERGEAALDVPFEPGGPVQATWLAEVFGADWPARAGTWLASLPPVGGQEGEELALASVLEELEEAGLRAWPAQDVGLVLYSDLRAREAREILARCRRGLRFLDDALGKSSREEAPLRLLVIQGGGLWQRSLHALATDLPAEASYLMQAKASAGFTLYRPTVSALYLGFPGQEEMLPANSALHNAVHLDLARRHGLVPLWLAEGLACAVEDRVTGEVWGNWYRDSFVYTVSHGTWRQSAARAVQKEGDKALPRLYAYPARPFEERSAWLAFAFAVYGLEADRTGFRAFLAALEKTARRVPMRGRHRPGPEETAALVAAAFGPDFPEAFRRWWSRAPDRPRR